MDTAIIIAAVAAFVIGVLLLAIWIIRKIAYRNALLAMERAELERINRQYPNASTAMATVGAVIAMTGLFVLVWFLL